jgi:hypothetical protein
MKCRYAPASAQGESAMRTGSSTGDEKTVEELIEQSDPVWPRAAAFGSSLWIVLICIAAIGATIGELFYIVE